MSHLMKSVQFPLRAIRLFAVVLMSLGAASSASATTSLVRTAYDSIIAESSGQCLDLGRVAGSPNAVAQWDCQGQTGQRWTIQRRSGSSVIINAKTRRCLAVEGDGSDAGASLVEAACNVPSRFWNVSPSGGRLQLVSRQSGLCATVRGASRTRGAAMELQPCTDVSHKRFVIGRGLVTPETPVHLIGQESGLCAVVPGAQSAAGTAVVQQACGTTLNTQWTLQPYASGAAGAYRIVAGHSGACLAVDVATDGAGMQSGARLVQVACSAQRAEQWLLRAQVSRSAYRLESNLSGLCLDVAGASRAKGAALVQTACSNAAPTQNWTLAIANPRASWGNLINLPLVPVAVSNLPDGRVLGWSAGAELYFEVPAWGEPAQTQSVVIDPSTGDWSQYRVSNTNHDMFCPGTSNLPDGRLLVSGGSSSRRTSIFNPFESLADPWIRGRQMNINRAYQGNTVLSTGDVFTLGGSWSGGIGNKTGELYSTSADAWSLLSGVPLPDTSDIIGPDLGGTYRGDNHVALFAQRDGWVFHAGPSAHMHWIDTKNGGSVSAGIPRGDDTYSINGNFVLYDTGDTSRILKLGGAPNYDSGDAFDRAYQIDINQSRNVAVKRLAPMNHPRTFSNSVVLPNGQVIVVGGQSRVRLFYDDDAVFETELWDPRTQVFTKLNAPIAVARNYHSVALLLQDGRVLSGGSGLCGVNAMQSTGCPGNHPDVQILTPPYLLNEDGSLANRPVISQAPAVAALGATITVDTDRPVSEWAMVRMSSTTHTVNNDQRRVLLRHTSAAVRNRYRLTIPAQSGTALPGYWMLFALDARGVPSVAKTLQIQ
ncbi:DUF1929 domain-containing protein [Methylolobus aquaticus]|nr:DUF1929 domain-containing protein [Methylolobus aquaticus]